MRDTRLSLNITMATCSLGLIFAMTSVLSAAPPEQLAKFAKEIDAFAWSMGIEAAENNPRSVAYVTPQAKHFKPRYEQDLANKKVQRWDGDEQYEDWVKIFYRGRSGFLGIGAVEGWAQKSKSLNSTEEMTTYANVLGRVIAAEWAKDNGVRKIDSNEVQEWGGKLTAATRNDNNGTKRMAALRSVADLVAAELRKP